MKHKAREGHKATPQPIIFVYFVITSLTSCLSRACPSRASNLKRYREITSQKQSKEEGFGRTTPRLFCEKNKKLTGSTTDKHRLKKEIFCSLKFPTSKKLRETTNHTNNTN